MYSMNPIKSRGMAIAAKTIETAPLAVAPFVAYYMFTRSGYYAAFIALVGLVSVSRVLLLRDRRLRMSVLRHMGLIGLYMIFGLVFPHILVVKLLPAFINLALFIMFTNSIFHPPSIIETFAEAMTKTRLGEDQVSYCRKVTAMWSVFFILDLALVVYVALFRPMLDWAIVTGVINYILIAVLFLGELAYRKVFFESARAKG